MALAVLTVAEVARRLHVSQEHARQLIAAGRIRRVPHVGRRVLVAEEELDRFIAAGITGRPAPGGGEAA